MATSKGEATKTRILDAAVDKLIVGGPENLNMDEVLAATKTSKGQLFHYFPGGKEELLHSATARQVERLLASDSPAELASLADWRAWFDQVIALHDLQSDADACEVAALAGRALDKRPEDRAIIGRVFEQWFALLHGQLQAMIRAGHLRTDAPVDLLASTVIACLQGGAVVDKATGSTDHLRRALDGAAALLESFGR